MIHLDTHIVTALHDGAPRSTRNPARRLIGSQPVYISPFVVFELELIKHKSLIVNVSDAIGVLQSTLDLRIADTSLFRIVEAARDIAWTRERMDRLIVAHAIADGARLLTRDARIRANFDGALWD